MARTLVTGATGFLGSHLARALAKRGDELRIMARDPARAKPLRGIEFELAIADVAAGGRRLREAMRGVSRVFHVAGITSMRPRDRDRVLRVNVEGTKNVMAAALKEGVERVVFTSSVAAIGPAARGSTADERQPFGGDLGVPYLASKREAETQVLRFAERGLAAVVVNPTFVLGPDDPTPGTSNALVRRFLLRRIPAYVDGAINIVDVRDVARGHLLADEKGGVGERYILGGRNFTLARLFADLSRISGVPPPIKLPGSLVLTGIEAAARIGLPVPTSVDEVKSGMQWWTYRSAKAKRELGFAARPHEETLEDTVEWLKGRLGDRVGSAQIYDPAVAVAREAIRFANTILGR